MHPGRSFRSITDPEIAPGQARLTLEFFRDRLPEKKLQLIDMSILSILLSPGSGCHNRGICFFWVSSLAYPNLLGKKGYVVVVRFELNEFKLFILSVIVYLVV